MENSARDSPSLSNPLPALRPPPRLSCLIARSGESLGELPGASFAMFSLPSGRGWSRCGKCSLNT